MAFLDSLDRSEARNPEKKLPLPALVALTALGLVLVFFLLQQAMNLMRGPAVELEVSADAAQVSEDMLSSSSYTSSELVVYVTGAVITPAVYHLHEGDRVADAVAAAGGFSEGAAIEALNLARPLVDGEQIHIPDQAAQAATGAAESPGEGAVQTGVTGQGGATESGKLNINRASAAELETLDGIGPATAQKIIDSRNTDGPFSSIEDLTRVSGIGEKRLAAIADKICV